MKKTIVFMWVLCLGFFVQSCQKEDLPQPKENAMDQEVQARKNNADIQATIYDENCSCYYEILEVNLQPFPGYPDTHLELLTTEFCEDGPCPMFQGYFNSSTDLSCLPTGANCTDIWPAAKPPRPRAFNCVIPRYSDFEVRAFFGALPEAACFLDRPFEEAELVFKIHCIEHIIGEGCNETVYSTEELSLSVSNTTISGFNHTDELLVSLGDCGCKPSLYAEPQLGGN